MELSDSYYKNNNVYEEFSKYQDKPNRLFKYLKNKIIGKTILDIWCWTWKFIEKFAPFAEKIIWVDLSENQINIAKIKTKKFQNIEYIVSNAENLNIPDNSIDIIIGSWFLWTIKENSRKKNIINLLVKKLNNNWKILLIENNSNWEFEMIRNKHLFNPNPTIEYNSFLMQNWFKIKKKIKTHFGFKNLEISKKIFGQIRWTNISKNIKNNKIKQNVIIFEKKKL